MVTDSLQNELVERLWRAVAPDIDHDGFFIDGPPTLDSAFAVSEFAAASIALAGLAAARLHPKDEAPDDAPAVTVDRPLAAAWFGLALTPVGWTLPSPWDDIAGDYRAADGWIRLHTNAPHHKAAALRALGVEGTRAAVEAEVAKRSKDDLEAAVVAAGGCAAVMYSWSEWSRHPQGEAVMKEPLVDWAEGSAGSGDGFRVLDLTRVIAGPVATRTLAGFGADVLRIDSPDWDEPAIVPDMTLGKRAARLDIKSAEGRATLEGLIAEADIVVHGYRADALENLGIDFDAIRPGIVDVAIDAYGWTGPWRNRRGFDSLVQMSSGIAEEGMRWFRAEKPTPLPVQALDHATGYLAAAAALTGLAKRRETGRGSRARLSLSRTGVELTGVGRGDVPVPAPIQVGSTLSTPWGTASLLPPPLTVNGEPPRWEKGPRPLGVDEPRW
jgi:crotonobetainyl-CoA:carnitine CoA-transferase CaiB-like acyl-CoA transferase